MARSFSGTCNRRHFSPPRRASTSSCAPIHLRLAQASDIALLEASCQREEYHVALVVMQFRE